MAAKGQKGGGSVFTKKTPPKKEKCCPQMQGKSCRMRRIFCRKRMLKDKWAASSVLQAILRTNGRKKIKKIKKIKKKKDKKEILHPAKGQDAVKVKGVPSRAVEHRRKSQSAAGDGIKFFEESRETFLQKSFFGRRRRP